MSLTPLFKKRKLKVGTTIEVRVTGPGVAGKLVRYTTRRNKSPTVKRQCLLIGASRPQNCPS